MLKSEKNLGATGASKAEKPKWYKRLIFTIPILLLVFAALVTLSLLITSTLLDANHGYSSRWFGDVASGAVNVWQTLAEYRIPRTLSVIAAGAGMSICGLIMQTITNNKFVSPMTTGTLDGARLGTLLAVMIIPTMGFFLQGLLTFVVTFIVSMAFIFMAERLKVKDATFLPLIGIIFGGVIAAITTIIALQSDGGMQILSERLLGTFTLTLAGWDVWAPIIVITVFVAIAYIFANWFMIAGLGEGVSKNLGLNYRLTVNVGLGIVSLITAAVLVLAGSFPFLGLVVPNMVSLYMGDNIKKSLPITAIFGAIFLLIADILARVVLAPIEIPAGVVVGVGGAGIFILLLLLQGKKTEIKELIEKIKINLHLKKAESMLQEKANKEGEANE